MSSMPVLTGLFFMEEYNNSVLQIVRKLFSLLYNTGLNLLHPTMDPPQPESQPQPQPPHYHIGLKPTRLAPNTYNLTLLSYTPTSHLILNHGQSLLNFNSKTKQLSSPVHHGQSAAFVKATHSQKWRCLFLLDQAQRIGVFLYEDLGVLAMGVDCKAIRHCLDFMFMDEYGAFLVLTPQALKLVYVDINSNHLRSLFPNAYKFKMKQTKVKTLQTGYFLEYANKIRKVGEYIIINNSENVKIIWHAADRHFNERDSEEDRVGVMSQGIFQFAFGELPHSSKYSKRTVIHLTRVCESPQQITQLLYNPEQCLLICGTNQGNLKVFKVNTKNIIATTSPTLKSHQIRLQSKTQLAFKLPLHNSKPILSIQLYSPHIILSLGSDEYLEVISFDQMASIQKFKSASQLADINFVTNAMFLGIKMIGFDQFLYCFEIELDYQLVVQHNSQIVFGVYVGGIGVFVLTDNSVNVVKIGQTRAGPGLRRQKSISKAEKGRERTVEARKQSGQEHSLLPKQSFVPPRCKSILVIESYPYKKQPQPNTSTHQQFWILTDQSQIYRYTFTTPSPSSSPHPQNFSITGLHQLSHFIDSYKHQTKQKVCTMKFLDLVPVYYDSDIKEKRYERNQGLVEQVRPIAFGCLTGEFMVCSSLEPNRIVARVRCFGEPVTAITSCWYADQVMGDGRVHRRRLVIYSSFRQIVAVMMSNQQIPQIIYKLLVPSPQFTIKPLSPYLTSILNGSTPKLLLPSPTSPSRLHLWTPLNALHESPITCMEYCSGIRVCSGDATGKIVIWNLYSEVLGAVVVSQGVAVQMGYCWGDRLMFGYCGKIFELKVELVEEGRRVQDMSCIVEDQEWLAQSTIELALNSNPRTILQFFAVDHMYHEHPSFHSLELQRQTKTDRSIDKYVENMRKALIKITHEAEGRSTDIVIPDPQDLSKQKQKIKRRTKKAQSTIKYSPRLPTKQQPSNSKITRAKSILNKFKQIQQTQTIEDNKNDISLPQIKNLSKFELGETKLDLESARKKKNRNKKYQFLFHFPNEGFYTQLLSKNMLQ